MKLNILALLALSMCILSATGSIIYISPPFPAKYLKVPIFTNVDLFEPELGGIMCSLGSGQSIFGQFNSRIELMLNADPAVMKADCVGVINLSVEDENQKKVAVYMTFSPGSLNLLKYSMNVINRAVSVQELFGKTAGTELLATQNSTPSDILFETDDGDTYRFQGSIRTEIEYVKLQAYQNYYFDITIDPIGSFN